MEQNMEQSMTNMVSAVLNELYTTNLFYRTHAKIPGTVVYGSLIWRIIRCVDELIRQANSAGLAGYVKEQTKFEKQACDPKFILRTVLKAIADANADIDMFVPSSVKFYHKPGEYSDRNGRVHLKPKSEEQPAGDEQVGRDIRKGVISYGWLAYRYEAKVVADVQKEIQTLSDEKQGRAAMLETFQHMMAKLRQSDTPDVRTIEMEQQVGEFQIKFQIHQCKIDEPVNLLNECFAPFFTAESLMWVSGKGMSARFGLDLNTVIRDICYKELHLVCPKELSQYFEGYTFKTACDSMREKIYRLANRMCKYKRYGFTLKLDEDSIKCGFVDHIIRLLMSFHIETLSPAQKREIADGLRPTIVPGDVEYDPDYDEEPTYEYVQESAELAWAAQDLYHDFLMVQLEVVVGMPSEIANMIAMFAARANEEVYHEDPVWQATIAAEKARIAELVEALQRKIEAGP